MRYSRPYRWTALLLSAALLAGCGILGGDDAATERIYTIYPNDYNTANIWTMDQDGNTVLQEERFTILYDKLTGRPQCKMRHRPESTGEVDEYGNAKIRDLSALYDLKGNLLVDWEECFYQEGFGDLVIRQSYLLPYYDATIPEDFESVLWNYKTGESVVEDVGHIQMLEEGKTAAVMDTTYRPLGVVDTQGKALSGFPAPEKYAFLTDTWNGYMIASSRAFLSEDQEREHYYLLTPDFEEVFSHQFLSVNRAGSYLYYGDNDDQENLTHGLLKEDGTVALALEPEEYTHYYDNELAIVGSGEYDNSANPIRRKLVRISDGETLAEGCSVLEYSTAYDDDAIPKTFIGYKDGLLRLLDRKGRMLAERELAGVDYIGYIVDDLYACTIREGEGYRDIVLGGKLETVVPEDRYLSVYQATNWSAQETEYYPLLIAQRRIGDSENWQALTDILDMDGNVLLEGLSQVYECGPDRLAVRKGFEVGLMDMKGAWIVKRSCFSMITDD